MPYVHNAHGHSDVANHLADELCDLLNRFSEAAYQVRLEQVEAGTAPATPWEFNLVRVSWQALCANSMEIVQVGYPVRDWTPADPCPRCKTVHPKE